MEEEKAKLIKEDVLKIATVVNMPYAYSYLLVKGFVESFGGTDNIKKAIKLLKEKYKKELEAIASVVIILNDPKVQEKILNASFERVFEEALENPTLCDLKEGNQAVWELEKIDPQLSNFYKHLVSVTDQYINTPSFSGKYTFCIMCRTFIENFAIKMCFRKSDDKKIADWLIYKFGFSQFTHKDRKTGENRPTKKGKIEYLLSSDFIEKQSLKGKEFKENFLKLYELFHCVHELDIKLEPIDAFYYFRNIEAFVCYCLYSRIIRDTSSSSTPMTK